MNKLNIDKEWLEEQYIIKQLSREEIANIVKCSSTFILKWLKKYNIKVRNNKEAQKIRHKKYKISWKEGKYKDKEWLYQKYINERLSGGKIAEICNVSSDLIIYYLRKYNIKVRSKSEAKDGELHSNWRGGRIKKRDGYIYIKKSDHPHHYCDGYILEHRLIMEEHLRKTNLNHPALDKNGYLKRESIVHHINKIKTDNRIENLELTDIHNHIKIHKPAFKHGKSNDLAYLRKNSRENAKINKDYRYKSQKIWKKNNKEKIKKYEEKYKSKRKIQSKTRYLYSNLKINGQCKICLSNENLEFHHLDYNSPNNFEVLCRRCHNKIEWKSKEET